MKKTIAILFVGIIISFSACLKVNDGIDKEQVLSNEIKAQNPYQENDRIFFISDSDQEFILKVSSRKNEFHEFQNGNNATNYLIELEKTSIVSIDTSQHFSFYMEMESLSRPPEFKISFAHPTKIGMTVLLKLPLSKDSQEFIDSVYVQNKWYHDIYVKEVDKKDDKAYRLYYSTKLGVIKIDFSDNSYWELEKIE